MVGIVGGWDRVAASDDALPVATPSATMAVAPFDAVLRRVRVGDELPPVARPQEGVRYLFVSLDLTNTSPRPATGDVLADLVTIDAPGLRQLAGITVSPMVYRLGDAQQARALQPGVATPVVLIWEQDASQPVPETVTVTVHSHTWRPSAATGQEQWLDQTPVAEAVMKVDPLGEAK